jgi:hypothetical protein
MITKRIIISQDNSINHILDKPIHSEKCKTFIDYFNLFLAIRMKSHIVSSKKCVDDAFNDKTDVRLNSSLNINAYNDTNAL